MTKFNWSGANQRERFLKACFHGDELNDHESGSENNVIDLDDLNLNPLQLTDDDFTGIMPNDEKRKKIYDFIVENNPKIKREERFANKCKQLKISTKEFYELCWYLFMFFGDNPKQIRLALPIMLCQSVVWLKSYNTLYRKKGNKAKRLTNEIWVEIHNRNKDVTPEEILANFKI